MSKEKQIEEMAKLLHLNYDMPYEFSKGLAEFLIDEGYAKASDVAKGIFGNLRILGHIDFDGNICIRKDSFEELEKKYTEEGK